MLVTEFWITGHSFMPHMTLTLFYTVPMDILSSCFILRSPCPWRTSFSPHMGQGCRAAGEMSLHCHICDLT